MTEKNLGAEALVLEGEETPELWRGETGPPPCFVHHPDACGKCLRDAVMKVYGLPFCEIHGAEAKTGALEELYFDAANFLGRLDNIHVLPPNPATLGALRRAVSELQEAEASASGRATDEALRRAYPLNLEQMDEEADAFRGRHWLDERRRISQCVIHGH